MRITEFKDGKPALSYTLESDNDITYKYRGWTLVLRPLLLGFVVTCTKGDKYLEFDEWDVYVNHFRYRKPEKVAIINYIRKNIDRMNKALESRPTTNMIVRKGGIPIVKYTGSHKTPAELAKGLEEGETMEFVTFQKDGTEQRGFIRL